MVTGILKIQLHTLDTTTFFRHPFWVSVNGRQQVTSYRSDLGITEELMFFDRSNALAGAIPRPAMETPDWLVWLIALVFVWTGLGSYGVLNDNEGLYAQISHDMLTSGDFTHWIIPHLNGLPYMEKPPLLYWLTALAFKIFGESDWVVRLVPTLATLGCVWSMQNFSRRLYRPQLGKVAALMFVTGLGVQVICRTLLFDMLLTLFVTAGLMYAYLFKIEGRLRDLRIAHVFVALAVLTKGLVALLLFCMVTVGWLLLTYRHHAWRKFGAWVDTSSIILFLAIAAPWFIAASWVEPMFVWFFFVNEHVLRFLGLRVPHDFYAGPWWYYLPRITLYLFPWSFLWPIALVSKWSNESDAERRDFMILRKALILSWLVPLLFFSISNAKANYYLIISTPFMALNLALVLEQSDYLAGWRSAILGVVVAVCAAAVAIAIRWNPALLSGHFRGDDLTLAGMPWRDLTAWFLSAVSAVALVSALIAWLVPRLGLFAYASLSLCFMGAMLTVVHAMESSISDRMMASFIRSLQPARTVYLYRNFEQNSSLTFYVKSPIRIVGSNSNDLYWGDRLRPDNDIVLRQVQFSERLEPKAMVVPNNYLSEFSHDKLDRRFRSHRQFDRATVYY